VTIAAARPNATGAPGYSETLPCEPESARRARTLVSAALHAWGLEDLAESGTLVVSELISNAVAHTRCRLTRVTIARVGNNTIRVAVADTSRQVPRMLTPTGHSGSGRGLFLVDALSDRWGYDLQRASKVVWAELRGEPKNPSGDAVGERPQDCSAPSACGGTG
jgi:Histidine kinase-, DNA gyrase B-, and HSP90-like ATPase.